ncbi:MAG: MBL fold metallo-hydrolase [Verrucomicrobia bacterium]|nr:MBL fold metallo-hydrolase [Verrucomicrobiota bacterium]
MRILNLNPDTDIGASAWFVEMDGHRLLLDAGVHPKHEGRASLPLYRHIRDADLDAIVISHCHHDHVGSLPVAVREHPRARVLMTGLSYFIAERVLHNSVNVMERQAEETGRRTPPLFSHREVDAIAPSFQGVRYNREIEWGAPRKGRNPTPSPTLEFFDAGHALGSAGVLVRGRKETLFYSGDVCFHDQTLLRRARFDGVKAGVLILETTRGNHPKPKGFTREREVERLCRAIEGVFARKGCVLIPAFALGRTQEILAQLALWMRAGRLRRQPVFIGGLGRVFTEVYDLEAPRTHRHHPGLQLDVALDLQVLERGQAAEMRLAPGQLFVVTAGMMSEHTAAHDLAARMMPARRHGIFFVGYADPDTPGGRLKASKPGQPFRFSDATGVLTRECEMDGFDLTAHAQREDLLGFVGKVAPHTVLLGHGDAPARRWFEGQLRRRHPKLRIVQPEPGRDVRA